MHAIPRMIVAMFTDFDSNGRIRHGQSAEPLLYRSCQLGRRCPAGTPDRFGNGALFGEDRLALRIQHSGALVETLQFAEPIFGFGVKGHDCRQTIAILALKIVQRLAPLAKHSEPVRRFINAVSNIAHFGHEIIDLGEQLAEPCGLGRKRLSAVQR